LYAICWAEKEGINVKPTKSTSTSTTVGTATTTVATTTTATTPLSVSPQETPVGGMTASVGPQSSAGAAAAASTASQQPPAEISREDLTKDLIGKLLTVLEILKDVTL
jgi:hypothetical protein